jgi:hypothetical protein
MASFTFYKKDGKLIFENFNGYETRNPSTMWCIEQADKVYNWTDFKKLKVWTGDGDEVPGIEYSYCKSNNYTKLIPDFNFHAWPQVGIDDYETFVKEIDDAGLNNYEINKVGWIGNINTSIVRKKVGEIANKYPNYFDFISMNWKRSDQTKLNSDKYISTPNLVKKYSILIDIEGNGYSGRLKHLLWSHRPVLFVDRPYKEYFLIHLKEWIHYIPVKRDLSDLIEKTEWCLNNYDKALVIAENAYQFSKTYLTRNACYEKWNDIINNIE